MKIIPAIDIKGGKVVRLEQGKFDRETVYPSSPLEVAKKWASFGAGLIHIVDLDGALEGRLKNLAVVKEIAEKVSVKIELGGGIRDEAAIKEALDAGVDKVVIGTKALDKKFLKTIAAKFPGKIVVGIDARDGFVATKGWMFKTKTSAIELAKEIERAGIKTVNYTDIARDGMMTGPNISGIKELLGATKLEVIASGGVSTIDDIRRLKELESDGLAGVIIGKALYEGRIDLKEAIDIC